MTVTVNEQDAFCPDAFSAMTVTVVVPVANVVPLTGEAVTVIGGVPPETCAAGKVTTTGWPFSDVKDRFDGHVSVNVGEVDGGGSGSGALVGGGLDS